MEGLDEINIGNLELYKSQSKNYKKALNAIFFTCLRELPKELLIEGLKKKKIIKQDWTERNKYIENKD
jgi:hypothetical protein